MQKPGAAVNAVGSGGIVNKATILRPLDPDRICGEGSCTITRRGGEGAVLLRTTGEGSYARPYYEQAGDGKTAETPKATVFISDETDTSRGGVANPRGEGSMQYFGGEGESMAKRADQMPTA